MWKTVMWKTVMLITTMWKTAMRTPVLARKVATVWRAFPRNGRRVTREQKSCLLSFRRAPHWSRLVE